VKSGKSGRKREELRPHQADYRLERMMLLRCPLAGKAIGALVLKKRRWGNVRTHRTDRRLEKRVLTRLVRERDGRLVAGGRRERRFAFAR
jgi:hypothetical protein